MSYLRWIVVAGLLLGIWVWQQQPGRNVEVVFCDVGQGDSALVKLGYFQALFDTGKYPDKVLKCLSEQMPFWDKKIDVVFISHPDMDHNGALKEVSSNYEIGRLVDKADNGDVVRYGSLTFDILFGGRNGKNVCKNDNDCSVVVRLAMKKFSVIFTGDAGEEEELALLGMGVIRKTDILKVSHHGSKSSSTISFLEALEPKIAVISVGEKNSYGHPNRDTLLRIDTVGAKTLRTDKLGTIDVESDGEKFWVK